MSNCTSRIIALSTALSSFEDAWDISDADHPMDDPRLADVSFKLQEAMDQMQRFLIGEPPGLEQDVIDAMAEVRRIAGKYDEDSK